MEATIPRLSVGELSLVLGERVVLDDLALAVGPGEILGVLGPNGSGKTSLMRCITGLLRPDRGAIRIDGELLTTRSRALRARIGVVFQEPSLDDMLTARENLVYGAALFGVERSVAQTRADELLTFMEMSDRSKERVRTLSGGMRRRLELARGRLGRGRPCGEASRRRTPRTGGEARGPRGAAASHRVRLGRGGQCVARPRGRGRADLSHELDRRRDPHPERLWRSDSHR